MARFAPVHFLITIVFLSTSLKLSAENYNTATLKLHARVFPKVLLADQKLESKKQEGHITLTILHDTIDTVTAEEFRDQILKLYPMLDGMPLLVTLQHYDKPPRIINSSAYYLFPTASKHLYDWTDAITKNGRLSFAYSEESLKDGVLMSLKVANRISPVINIFTLRASRLQLDDSLYHIAKIRSDFPPQNYVVRENNSNSSMNSIP